MDFGILLQAIGYVAVALFFTGLVVGWIILVMEMIKNHVLQGIIGLLPLITFLTIMQYHILANS
jgi:hypothetical protein